MEFFRLEGNGGLENDVGIGGRGRGAGPCGPASARKGDFIYFRGLCPSQLALAGHQLPLHRGETLCGLVFLFGDFVELPLGVGIARRSDLSSQGLSK